MPALLPGPLLPARIKKAVFKKRLVRQKLEAPHREGIGNARCPKADALQLRKNLLMAYER